jgi:thiol-disulfide isomerase/thioredoxin
MRIFWMEFPNIHRSATLLTFYMEMFTKAHPDSIQTEWASFIGCTSPVASELARGKVRFAELKRRPLEIAFVSLDGRAVDLHTLRGKVVLIDFWATWCAPCIKQVPALRRLFAEYHKHGFEIIGVSLDRDEDRQKLVEFVSREGMTWPQHFGGGWQNEFVVRYAVNAVPTTFLLDTTGRLVGSSLTEDDLAKEVERLLTKR